jgi:translocation and assembly module TamB
VGYLRGGEWLMRDVRGRVQPLQVALLKGLFPNLRDPLAPIGGTMVGTLTLNGSTRTGIALVGDVEHHDRGGVSNISGRGSIRFGGQNVFDVDVRAHSLALGEVGLYMPSVGLHGAASGPIKAKGTLADLRLNTTLAVSGGGNVKADARLNLRKGSESYDVSGNARLLNLNAVVASAPRTSLTAVVRARGNGFQPATMRGIYAADFSASTWDSVKVDSGSVRVAVANGIARVDRMLAMGASTRVEAVGTFGLTQNRVGELRYSVAIDSLGAYNRWIPGAQDTGLVRPRPARVINAIARAREDSSRIARATEVERAATGKTMPKIAVDTPHALARSALAGKVYAAGVVRGNIKNFDLRGRLNADDLMARGNSAKSLRAEYAWLGARTKTSNLALAVEGSDISVKGFAFDTLQGRLSYKHPTGEIQLAVRQSVDPGVRGDRAYAARGTFTLEGGKEVKVNQMALRMDTTVWRLARAATFRSKPSGLELQDVELMSNTGGHLYVNGTVPTQGNANLVIDVKNFQVADVATFLQSDLPLQGVLTARGAISGTTRDPRFKGAAGLVNGKYNGTVIPDFQATFNYASASLATHVEALRKGATPSVVADATLPVNLALSGVTGPRLLDVPMRVDVSGDSLPLDLIPIFTDAVAQVRGTARGSFTMRGTLQRPVLAGALTWANGSMKIVPTGVVVENIAAAVRMARDTVWVDSIAGTSGKGPITIRGRLYVGNWREPAFDLHLVGTDAVVLDNERGKLDADVGLSLTGPFRNAYVAGLLNVRSGVIYIPATHGKKVINAGDPSVFAVMDTSLMYDRELFPTSSPLLENMRIDVDVAINRNTWARSRDANVEMYTEEPVRVHREADALSLTGVVSTDRGEYSFLSKRFQIKRGSATFVGGPELNPTLQATGEYEVAIEGRPNFNVRVLIGGTAQKPKITLESDAQPPISQSDLLSYLAFGKNTNSLLQLSGSSLTGATSTGNLIGVGAAFAAQQLASVALGVMADEVEGEATKGLGADVFTITPADVPYLPGSQQQSFGDFLLSTKVEAGKYLSPYFFMALQAQKYPGLRAQYRTPKGWRFEAAAEPRYILQPPELIARPVFPIASFGGFVVREWRF